MNNLVGMFNRRGHRVLQCGRTYWRSHFINRTGCDVQFEYDNLVTNPLKFQTFIYFNKYE